MQVYNPSKGYMGSTSVFRFYLVQTLSRMPAFEISNDFGYVLASAVGLYLLQQLVLVVPVMKARMR